MVVVAQHSAYTKTNEYTLILQMLCSKNCTSIKKKTPINILTRQIKIKDNNLSLVLKNKYSRREISNA